MSDLESRVSALEAAVFRPRRRVPDRVLRLGRALRSTDQEEREAAITEICAAGDSVSAAARALGCSRRTLQYWARKNRELGFLARNDCAVTQECASG